MNEVVHPEPERMEVQHTKNNKDNTFKRYLRQFLLSLDISGLKDIADEGTRLFLRITWIIILVLSMVFAWMAAAQNITDYLDNPLLTTYQLISGEPVPFPDIYVCPTNYINQSYVTANNVDLYWATYFRSNIIGSGLNKSKDILNFKQSFWAKLTENYGYTRPCESPNCPEPPPPPPLTSPQPIDSFQDYFLKIGYDSSAFIKECAFMNVPFNCSDQIYELFDRNYGKCFLMAMNSSNGQKFLQRKEGTGLSLVVDINGREYPRGVPDPPLFDGIYMFMDYLFSGVSKSPLLLKPGSYYRIDLSPMQINSISGKFKGKQKNCMDGWTAPDGGMKQFYVLDTDIYSEESCGTDCFQQAAVNKCSCVLAMDEKYLNKTVLKRIKTMKSSNLSSVMTAFCLPQETIGCIIPNIQSESASSEQDVQECLKHCYPPCSSWKYQPTLSRFDFPSSSLREMNLSSYTHHKINTIIIDISYPTLQYTKITQSASMTLGTFLSNVGGTLGLYLGVSILTGFQIILAILSLCCNKESEGTKEKMYVNY